MKRKAKKAVVFVVDISFASVLNDKVLILLLVLISDGSQMLLLFLASVIFLSSCLWLYVYSCYAIIKVSYRPDLFLG